MKVLIAIATSVMFTLKLADVIDWSWWIVFSPVLACWAAAALGWAIGLLIFRKVLKQYSAEMVSYAFTQDGK